VRGTIRIEAGDLRAEIVPSLGAGLARFDLLRNDGRTAIFRPWPAEGTDDPNRLAAYVLLPWSNRISGGGFRFRDAFHRLEANFPGEPCPLHGNGWTSDWTVVEAHRDRSVLELLSNGPGPFRYAATLGYALLPTALDLRLSVTNRGEAALPYGLGFHPWLPRTPDTQLQAAATTVWLEDERHLPTVSLPVSERPQWDFRTKRHLPADWINNGFAGWDGHAQTDWPSRGLSLSIVASDQLRSYLLYSPGGHSPFFCFEPVSHVVDAHNLTTGEAARDLIVLAPGDSAEVTCRFVPTAYD
jgi:aldose 1-epimerase